MVPTKYVNNINNTAIQVVNTCKQIAGYSASSNRIVLNGVTALLRNHGRVIILPYMYSETLKLIFHE